MQFRLASNLIPLLPQPPKCFGIRSISYQARWEGLRKISAFLRIQYCASECCTIELTSSE